MKTLLPGTAAYLAGPVVGLVTLVLMQFPAANLALCSSTMSLFWGGDLYLGANALGTISEISDGPGEIRGLKLTLSGVDSSYLALAFDDAAVVQGTPLTIRTGIVGASHQLIDAGFEWVGRLDTMSIEEDGDTCTIQVTAESNAVDLLHGAALTYSDADQKSLYPNDRAFEFSSSQVNTPVVWPSKQWLQLQGPR